ncbi:MAG: prolipoprotein diacylglyceryl transferase [bacterium]
MFLHSFIPSPILWSLGPVSIYWYGLMLVIGIISGLYVTVQLGQKHNIKKDTILDLAFYLVLFSILGARIYDIFLELPYYIANPIAIFKIWQGGLAIHGALIGGGLTIYWFTKKYKQSFIKFLAVVTPGLALGQAIGRWGNYFNQELFGLPTNLPWGIPINLNMRPSLFNNSEYFHPTFLYESLGNLLIFVGLYYFVNKLSANKNRSERYLNYRFIFLGYLLAYSVLRFFLEFIRIDFAPNLFGLRWPQIMSLIIVASSIFVFYHTKKSDILANRSEKND